MQKTIQIALPISKNIFKNGIQLRSGFVMHRKDNAISRIVTAAVNFGAMGSSGHCGKFGFGQRKMDWSLLREYF
ncbi:hypothetical protein FHS21_005922 [Phyllobacterium trifolii]|uniref:Uncharacterized protein n=1 Tax=Phyllobacterium trifolii TaxID=300193 RepID=A0A839UEC4_9HYPH|nr:hypothetical protein [Phyllobacterium trifolii]MBB3149468.1 hypothetical protein [Phyllobacterium trifolii]